MRTEPPPSILWARAFVVNIGSEDGDVNSIV